MTEGQVPRGGPQQVCSVETPTITNLWLITSDWEERSTSFPAQWRCPISFDVQQIWTTEKLAFKASLAVCKTYIFIDKQTAVAFHFLL